MVNLAAAGVQAHSGGEVERARLGGAIGEPPQVAGGVAHHQVGRAAAVQVGQARHRQRLDAGRPADPLQGCALAPRSIFMVQPDHHARVAGDQDLLLAVAVQVAAAQ